MCSKYLVNIRLLVIIIIISVMNKTSTLPWADTVDSSLMTHSFLMSAVVFVPDRWAMEPAGIPAD